MSRSSSQKYFIDSKYGAEIFSRSTTKINHNTLGLIENSDFFISLYNNTSGNVVATLHLDGVLLGTYEIEPHSIYKLISYLNPNQFYKFNPGFRNLANNTFFSELKIEWIPIITQYTYSENYKSIKHIDENNKSYYDKFNKSHFGQTQTTQTMMDYDRRINHGCSNSNYPKNTFTDDLSLGISSDKFKLAKKYVNGEGFIQKIYLIVTNPEYNVVNVRNYFVYNERSLDIPENQLFDSIL
jgi:hypothetical protein